MNLMSELISDIDIFEILFDIILIKKLLDIKI